MHEVSLMSSTLNMALDCASRQGAQKIHRLKMRVGEQSGVVPEALEFAFEVVTQGTIAEGANLEVEKIPVICYCVNCKQEFQPDTLFYECPDCQQLSTEVRCGREIELTSLEVS
jgi:hydrogenase nickel incorporation protein HypA/HybF